MWLDQFVQDVRFAWRGMRQSPTYVVLTAFPQECCAVFGFTGQYVRAVGLRFTTYFSWCGPRMWRGGYVPCISPTFLRRRGIIAALVSAVLTSAGCSEYAAVADHMVNRIIENAVAGLRAELPPAQASQLELRTTGTRANGFYVFSVDRSGNPEFVWVFVREGHFYALGKEELALTPRLPLIEAAPADVQREAGLVPLSRPRVLQDLASRDGRYVSHPPPAKSG